MSDINIDFVEFIRRLKMDKKKTDVFMLDFEKTSPFHTSVGGIIMDIGYNFVDLRSAISADNVSKPPSQFISDNTAKVVYEVLRNPIFYKELSELKRVKRESNAFLYDYYNLLTDQGWFSTQISEGEVAAEFRNFAYKALKDSEHTIGKQITRHQQSIVHWQSKGTYKKDPVGSPAAKRAKDAEQRYDRANNSLKKVQIAIQQEFNIEKVIAMGNYSLNRKINKMQENYQTVLYLMQKSADHQFFNTQSQGIDYERTWAQDKAVFDKLGYGGIIEPWKKIMTEMERKLKSKSETLLAISAYNIGAEKSNFETTSRFFGTPEYANFIDNYYNICMQNLVSRLDTVDPGDLLNLINSKDDKVIASVIKSMSGTGLSVAIPLEVHYRDMMEKPKYAQSHTGVKDAFDQSEAFIQTIRQEIVPNMLNGRK